jgi:hypothetical protein
MTTTPIGVADVLAVRTGGIGGWAIRLGAQLRGLPHDDNHVVIAHHQDPAGVWWGLEGRPGGIGWVDLRRYLDSPATVTNAAQPRTDAQRAAIAADAVAMLGTAYDWPAVVHDALTDLDLADLWSRDWNGKGAPGHIVCSSYAAWLYGRENLPRPDVTEGGRWVQPGDWAAFDLAQGWNLAVAK